MLRKLEKYDILEEIGHGGMATVYRAHDTVLDRPVALKVMHPHLRAAEEARRRFHREARSVARLRHPRVLEIYDFSGEGSSEAYIAAELLTGPTLKLWREQHEDVPAEIAACFAIEIAQALEAAHTANIVHRDVKPENVLLHENREIKLTDFGIADMIDAQSMTATGQILGSPGHMAPEQIEGKDCDARTDLFSLGTVLYYLATGRLPFTGRNPHQVLKRIVDGEYADPLRVNPTIGGRLRAIIVKALEHDAADRYQSAREMIGELEAFVREAGIEDPTQMLERYLRDPEKVGAEVRAQLLDRLIEHGSRASDAGDVPTALDYYNRVLALDEGNERVLKLIERVGMDRRRRAMLLAAAGLTAFGAVTALGAWALWPEPHVEVTRPTIDEAPPVADAGTDAGAIATSEPADAGQRAAADAAELALAAPDAVRTERPVVRDRAPRPREVLFVSEELQLQLSIDDGPPEPFRLGLRRELASGRHSVRLDPVGSAADQFQMTVQSFVVPIDGEDPHEVRLRPDRHRARFTIRTDVPGLVFDARSGARLGRTNDLILVPMSEPTATLYVNVRAAEEGYRSVERQRVSLTSGQTTPDILVALEPVTPTP